MAPLIRNISRQEVQWVNSSSSCTYNKICFFRRTGFVVYLADHATIIGHFLIISASNRYNELQDQSIPGSLMLGLTPATYLAASLSGSDEEAAIRGNWNWISLAYGKDGRTVAGLVFYWIGCVFMFWSTIAMWHCYAYHNIHWPFANHARQRRSHGAKTVLRSSVILNSSELAEPRGN
ncbi:unnamed protein product [Aspergillus niger]|nr:unnamed protein product [Aspergillus niger]